MQKYTAGPILLVTRVQAFRVNRPMQMLSFSQLVPKKGFFRQAKQQLAKTAM